MIYARVKHLIFQYYGIVALFGFLGAALWFFRGPKGKDELTLFVTIVGGLASAIFFIQKQKLEELQLFKELFVDFNCRYDELNEDLNKIVSSKEKVDLTSDEKNKLNDYFNLCAEEFLFYRRGYIYLEVWTAWHNGMKYFLEKDKRIADYWEKEKQTESYYGLEIKYRKQAV
jgi:hypothetical protein